MPHSRRPGPARTEHAGVGTEYTVIASISRGESGVSVAVAGGNWLRIGDAEDTEDREVYKGAGWVFAVMLAIDTTAGERELKNENAPANIYQEPDRRSSEVGTIPAQTPVKLAGCRGSWALIRRKQIEGWLPKNPNARTR